MLLPKLLRRLLFAPLSKEGTVGFFHPFTQDGGGGERVLWCAIQAIQEQMPSARCIVYTGENARGEELGERALERFGIQLKRPVEVVHLDRCHLVLASRWPRFTLLGQRRKVEGGGVTDTQALGSIILTWEGLLQMTPSVFIDTGGYAFGYPLAWLAGSLTACYIHYPY
ncbi:hypothetical protein CYMTET_53317 [Cymbomonas tetramitiformis]|uniref:ALG11 mannosyltransferase N-terminal domain-containing protein n=1 Tax=Cymbomonas tetramitiformis TaxID=36881 RepID=A0AAE0BH55_9CHLO|nr:hypothetical protein CYMTET_53317 [Cymbomonas tetramitiformis]